VLAAASLYALVELGAGLLLGGFFLLGRAEALIFLALRPWLLIAAAWLVVRRRAPERSLFYLLALLVAAAAEILLVLHLGAVQPCAEAACGILAGLLVAGAADLAAQLGRRLWGRAGTGLALALVLLLFLLPAGPRLYERVLLPAAGAAPGGSKPGLMLMTGLPLVWGEAGPLDPNSRPAEAYRVIDQAFTIRPLDVLDQASLGSGRLLLLAQPRRLASTELAALDRWVRGGGRVLILADPQLDWPSELPLGDIRRPPPVTLLGPLLDHWGVRLEIAREGRAERLFGWVERRWRIALASPGRVAGPETCLDFLMDWWALHCRIGSGVAVIMADADLLRDDLWAPAGTALHQRIADNPYLLTRTLDMLAGVDRTSGAAPVWSDPLANRTAALLLALVPPLVAATPALLLRLRRRRR